MPASKTSASSAGGTGLNSSLDSREYSWAARGTARKAGRAQPVLPARRAEASAKPAETVCTDRLAMSRICWADSGPIPSSSGNPWSWKGWRQAAAKSAQRTTTAKDRLSWVSCLVQAWTVVTNTRAAAAHVVSAQTLPSDTPAATMSVRMVRKLREMAAEARAKLRFSRMTAAKAGVSRASTTQ